MKLTKYRQNNDDYIFSAVGSEIVLMNIESGDYFELNESAKEIWHMVEEPSSEESLIERLMSIYDVDLDTCTREVRDCLEKMLVGGMVLEQND